MKLKILSLFAVGIMGLMGPVGLMGQLPSSSGIPLSIDRSTKRINEGTIKLPSGATLTVESGGTIDLSAGGLAPETPFGSTTADGQSVWIMNSYKVNKLVLSASVDGKNWKYIDAEQSYPAVGDGGAASMIYFGGRWVRAYTTSAANDQTFADNKFSVDASYDLRNWTVIATPSFSSVTNTSGGVWAQQWFQEPGTTDYTGLHVFCTVSVNNLSGPFAIYETHPTNSGLTSWSTPVAVTGTSLTSNVIDPCVVKIGSTYYLWFKNETTKRLGYWTSSSLLTGYTVAVSGTSDTFGFGANVEAPCLVQVGTSTWRIYYDQYLTGGFKYSESSDTFATWTTPALCGQAWTTMHPDVIRLSSLAAVRSVLAASLTGSEPLSSANGMVGINAMPDRALVLSGPWVDLSHGTMGTYSNGSGVQFQWNLGRNNANDFCFYINGTGMGIYSFSQNAFLWEIAHSSNDFTLKSGSLLIPTAAKGVVYGTSGPIDTYGSGTPEGAVSAPVGSTYRRTDGGTSTSFYVKESGSGNTGWVAK